MAPRALLRSRLFPVLACASAAAAYLASACITTEAYVYTAQRYDSAGACLEDYRAIEQVAGKGASSQCAPTCLEVDGELFVSTMCPPLPGIATAVPDDDPTCAAARAASRAETSCTAPAPEEAGAADDASPDTASPEPDATPTEDAIATPQDASADVREDG